MKTALVLGFGVSGKAAAKLLALQGKKVLVFEENEGKKEGSNVIFVDDTISFTHVDEVIFSPGFLPTHPLLLRAKSHAIPIYSEMHLGLKDLSNVKIAVTGTNGKTTAVLWIEHVLNAMGKKARAVGNLGVSITDVVPEIAPEEILIVELSSYQLETLFLRTFDAGAVLNITPNHLDRHPSMEAYVQAKANLQNCLKEGAPLFLSQQVREGWGFMFPYSKIENLESNPVWTLCAHLGVSSSEFALASKSFTKPKHRLEWVRDQEGVSYYNDSKSSNVASVLYAIEQFDRPLILLVGGVHKGSSYDPWVGPFQKKVKHLIAYGKAAPLIEDALGQKVAFSKVDTLQEAILLAKKQADKGDIVLLSPGCSSFDQFTNFEERGEVFKQMI